MINQFRVSRPNTTNTHMRNTYSSTQEGPNRSRMQRSLVRDRENLYDENIQLKLTINQLREENQKLKMIKLQMERELYRFEKFIEEQSKQQCEHGISRSSQMERSGLVLKLKTKQKALAQELIDAKKQIEDLKRTYRTTRIQELEIELQNALDETVRLRQQLTNVERIVFLCQPQQDGISLEERYILQEKTMKSLQQDNHDMHKQLKELEQQNRSLRVKLDEVEKSMINAQKENQRAQSSVLELQRELKNINKNNQKQEENSAQHIQLQFVQQMTVLKLNYEEQIEKLKFELNQLGEEILNRDERINQLTQLIPQEPSEHEESSEQTVNFEPEEPEPIQIIVPTEQPPIQTTAVKRRLPRVRIYDVEHVGHRLRVQLHKNAIPYEFIDSHFEQYSEHVSIAELKKLFSSSPFCITEQSDLTLLCRYLVEDNQEEFIIFDEERHNDVTVVKSIIKKLIGKYELFTENEIEHVRAELQKKISSSMIDTIQMIIIKKKHKPGECDAGDFEAALKFHELLLTQRQMEYLNLLIYEMSQNLNVIHYQELIRQFTQ